MTNDLMTIARRLIEDDLALDIGRGDATSLACIPADARFRSAMIAREAMTVAGLAAGLHAFRVLDADATVTVLKQDGARCAAGEPLAVIEGNARAILAAERTALNFVQHLSGIATATAAFVAAIAGTRCVLLDTRKTTPGLRALEKAAVVMGGGTNHRLRLDDGMLIKDNHIAACGGVAQAVAAAVESNPQALEIQVEVDSLAQIEPALSAGAQRLLCDNFSLADLRAAVAQVAGRVPIEASGGVSLSTVAAIAATGVDFVSTSKITQGASPVDIALDHQPAG